MPEDEIYEKMIMLVIKFRYFKPMMSKYEEFE